MNTQTFDPEFGELFGVSPKSEGLNMQQAIFVTEYAKSGSATQAAAAAGYSRPRIPEGKAVRQAIADTLEECGVTAKRTITEIAKLAFHDVRKLFDANGKLIELHKLDDETAAAIASFEVSQSDDKTFSETSKVKMTSKLSALEHVSKMLRLTTDQVELAGADGGPVQMEYGPNENVRRVAFLLEQATRQMRNTAGSRSTAPAQHRGSNQPGE